MIPGVFGAQAVCSPRPSGPAAPGVQASSMMSTLTPFRIPVADLLRRPGTSRAEHVEASLPGVGSTGAEVPPDQPVRVDVTLERVPDGIVVRGSVKAPWQASCSRCLAPVAG